MNNALDMLNVCIAPTRLCNLRCNHCYIEPALLNDKAMMDEGLYRKSFKRIEELFNLDQKVTKINIELLGGELSMMPLDYWERNLPWTLDVMATWAKLFDAEASLIWCTNLIFKDEGYTDLLNRTGERYGDSFDIFVPWEPDTNRFLKDDKLLPRYFRTLEAITKVKRKTLCITMSKAVIERGPQYIVDEFVSRGITDISCDMLYPAGSGKEYFKRTCSYGEVSEYIIDLSRLLPDGVDLSPLVEMENAIRTLTHFHYPGNDTYDLEFEQSGEVTFNSSYTGSESIFGTQVLSVDDDAFAIKAVFNNTPEMVIRHSMPYDDCNTCEYAVACSGGWAWHKNLAPQMRSLISGGDCAGLKKVWDHARSRSGVTKSNRSEYMHLIDQRQRKGSATKRIALASVDTRRDVPLIESSFSGAYDDFFKEFDRPRVVAMASGSVFGKSWIERLFFYDAIGAQILTGNDWYAHAADEGGEELFRHIIYRNFNYLHFDNKAISTELVYRANWQLSQLYQRVMQGIKEGKGADALNGMGYHDELMSFCLELIDSSEAGQ